MWADAPLSKVLEIYGAIFNIHGRVGSAAVAALAFGFLAIILASFPREREDLNASILFSEYVLVLGILVFRLWCSWQ